MDRFSETEQAGFIRAFWRRVWGFRNNYEKELPTELPVEFVSAFGTASMCLESVDELRDELSERKRLEKELPKVLEHDAECPSLCDLVAIVGSEHRQLAQAKARIESLSETLDGLGELQMQAAVINERMKNGRWVTELFEAFNQPKGE